MENILSQIPQSVIEMYYLNEDESSISLYSNAINRIGYISLPKEDIKVWENESCITLKVVGKLSVSLWKEVEHTHLILF